MDKYPALFLFQKKKIINLFVMRGDIHEKKKFICSINNHAAYNIFIL